MKLVSNTAKCKLLELKYWPFVILKVSQKIKITVLKNNSCNDTL